ncbi:hypothetical protein [Nocardioides sp.]|uniref:ABC transporter permease n=1 Tax=Nocardioides sp. TaxID=35761 RepID=UPI0026361056|nr:hypothetical protein [Nocardioides sp.]
MTSSLTGATALAWQNLRRDRIIAAVWLVLMAAMAAASAYATPSLISSPADQRRLALELNAQPALRALYGPILDPDALGEVAMSKMTVLYALIAAILFVVVLRRHTRVEEESGRAELLAATVIGRNAPLAGAVLECLGLAVVLGAVVFAASALGGLPVAGSLWFGLSWVGTAAVATGVAAVACQLSASARTCAAIAAAVLGAFYVVRALGDGLQATWLSWCSPLGWNTQLRAWSDPRIWVLALYAVTSALLLVVAAVLRGARDLGEGLVAARPGRTSAPAWLGSALGLVVRVHRTGALLWAVALFGGGIAFGAMSPGLDSLVASMGGGQELIDRLGGAMIAAVLSVLAMAVTFFGVSIVAAAGADEAGGHAELVLATGVSRRAWFGAVVGFALIGSAVLVLLGGLGLMIGDALAGGARPWTALVAAGAWVGAVVAVQAVVILAWSHRAAWSVLGWGVVALCLLDTLLGELLRFPTWLVKVSPYSVVPQYPVEAWRWSPVLGLWVGAALVGLLAWFRFRERDIG